MQFTPTIWAYVKIKDFYHFNLTVHNAPCFKHLQGAPVVIAGSDEQKKKYLGRLIEEPIICVSYAKPVAY